jgi:hypothetical protein
MALGFRLVRFAPLVVLAMACSSASTTQNDRSTATCGNQVVEPGEQCDGLQAPTCAQVTGNPTAVGVAQCSPTCVVFVASCPLGANPGVGGTNGGSGFPGNGGVPSYGGIPVGGLTGQGGIPIMGGAPPFGGFPTTGGAPPFGGFPATGGDPGSGGFFSTGGAPSNGGFVSTGGDPGNGGSQSTGGSPSTGPLGDLNALRQACLETINQYRATLSLPPLNRASASVETCSDNGAQSDASTGVAHGSAGDCPGMSAQNTCPGWNPNQYGGVVNALKACLQAMWNEGEPPVGRDQCLQQYFAGNTACVLAHGHYLNMSGSNPVVSCGFYAMPNGRVWMNQDFGR